MIIRSYFLLQIIEKWEYPIDTDLHGASAFDMYGDITYNSLIIICLFRRNAVATHLTTANEYTLTVDPNGGSYWPHDYYSNSDRNHYITDGSSWSKTFTYDSETKFCIDKTSTLDPDVAMSKPYKKGYTFDGWEVVEGGGSITHKEGYGYYFDGKHVGNVSVRA